MKIWFTSDTHLGHARIILYCGRPFVKPAAGCEFCGGKGTWTIKTRVQGQCDYPCNHPDIELHDRTIIERWNAVVAPDDEVYHLGDLAFGNFERIHSYVRQLNGHITLVMGNHDRLSPDSYARMGLRVVRRKMTLGSLRLQHRPEPGATARGITLCGHVHERWPLETFRATGAVNINVGVDVRDFRPVSLEQLGVDPNLAF